MRFSSRYCWRLFYSLRRSKSCELVSINKVSNESFGDNLRRNERMIDGYRTQESPRVLAKVTAAESTFPLSMESSALSLPRKSCGQQIALYAPKPTWTMPSLKRSTFTIDP